MESNKTKILKILRNTDGYLSGQELCEQLGISRTAVWKYMKQLKEEGYEIQSVQNKGYCLMEVPEPNMFLQRVVRISQLISPRSIVM